MHTYECNNGRTVELNETESANPFMNSCDNDDGISEYTIRSQNGDIVSQGPSNKGDE